MKTNPKNHAASLKKIAGVTACALTFLFGGCDPQEVVRWSPNGEHALVQGTDATYVIDAQGNLVGKATGESTWMPDSRHLLVVRKVKPRDWAEYAKLLGTERAELTARAAEELLSPIRSYTGDWGQFAETETVKQWERSHPNLGLATNSNAGLVALFYLREKYPQDLVPLTTALEHNGKREDLDVLFSELFVDSILPDARAKEPPLVRSADDILWVRPTPNGKSIAYVVDEPQAPTLYVVPAPGGASIRVDSGAMEADWSVDGQWLVYAKTTLPYSALQDQMLLGTITHRRVCDAEGAVRHELDDPEDLAGVLLGKGISRVACLPDGRILFAGTAVKLPALSRDMPSNLTLFVLRLGETPVIERVVSEKAQELLPSRPDRFVVSPDGEHVAIPGDSGEVAVVSLKTGDVQLVQEKVADFGSSNQFANEAELIRPAPSWRGPGELCYVVPVGHPSGSPGRAEIVLRPLGGEPRAISKSWPNTMTDRFLPRPKN